MIQTYKYKKLNFFEFSPSLKKPIAMAYIEYEFSEVGNEVYIESRGTKEKGIITKLPFVSHNYKK